MISQTTEFSMVCAEFSSLAAKLLRLTQAALWLRGFTVSVSVADTELDGKTSGSNPEPESSYHQGFKGTICAM